MLTTIAAAYLLLAVPGQSTPLTLVPYNSMQECVAAERSLQNPTVKLAVEHECITGSTVSK